MIVGVVVVGVVVVGVPVVGLLVVGKWLLVYWLLQSVYCSCCWRVVAGAAVGSRS